MGVAKFLCEARAFSTLGFLIVEIDFARIGAVSGTIVIDGGPARSAPLDAAAASTAQTAAADKANRNWTPFLLCMDIPLAQPSAPAFHVVQGQFELRACCCAACTWTAATSKKQASEITQFKHRRHRSFGPTSRSRLTSEGIIAGAPIPPIAFA